MVLFQADIRARVVAIHKAEKGKKALEILDIMSYFSSESISVKIFTDLAGGSEELGSAVELLKQYSVVNLSQQDPTMLNISELTQQVIRTILKEKDKEKVTLKKALNLFEIELESGNLNYAVSTWCYASAYPKFARIFSMLPSNIVQKLGECGRYEEAYSFGIEQLKVLEECNNSISKSYLRDNMSESYLRYKIGNVLLRQKKFEEALRIYDDPKGFYKDVKIFLRYAAEDGNLEATKFLAESKGVDNKICYGKSLLHCAIQGNNLEVVRFLVEEKGVNFNLPNFFSITPIQYASEQGNLDMVKFLVEKGANFNYLDNYRQASVHHAAIHGNLDIVKYLVESGADFKSYDDDLKTPLHYAAEEGSLDVVKFLVENGADVSSADRYGKTSIHYASEGGSLGIVKFLVGNGSDVNSTDKHGKTSLHYAAYIGNLDAVRFLIKKGANVNVIDKNRMTPLDYAIEKLDPVKPIDHIGGTQLHYAVYYGHTKLIQNLLKRVNNNQLHDFINHRTKGGNSALDLAIKAGNKNIIKILDQAFQEAPYTNVENVSMAGTSGISFDDLS